MLSRSFGQTAWHWQIAGYYDARDMLSAELEAPGALFRLVETLKITRLGVTQDLDPLPGEIDEETGKRQSGPVNGRLPDFAVVTVDRADQLHLEKFGVPAVKLTDLDERTFAFDHRADKSFRSMVKRLPAGLKPAGQRWTKSANLSVTQLGNTRI
jgi:hypothetical protein